MTSDQIGGLVGIAIFFVLPILIGLVLLFKARSLARSQLRFLAEDTGERLEPNSGTVLRYRLAGIIFIVAPIVIFLVGILATMRQ